MAKQEYFIDDDSKTKSAATYSSIINAHDITPICSFDKGSAIRVFQDEDFDERDRTFAFAAILGDDVSPTPLVISTGKSYLSSDLHSVTFRDNMSSTALSWETPAGDKVTLIGIFYGNESVFRFTGKTWVPVGPASTIRITSRRETGISATYQVSYNHFSLSDVFGCYLHNGFVDYYEAFGIEWLANALEYRYDQLDKKA